MSLPQTFTDACFYLEATANDKGKHDPTQAWWLSPDINLNGQTDQAAQPPATNTVQITVHEVANCNLGDPPPFDAITVDLYVGDPSLYLTPTNTNSTNQIFDSTNPLNMRIKLSQFPTPSPGATSVSASTTINWLIPTPAPTSGPQSPGHKCLIARCYPDNLSPDSGDFWLPNSTALQQAEVADPTVKQNFPGGDPHVVQHNIAIAPIQAHSREGGNFRFNVATTNPNPNQAETTTVSVLADYNPSQHVLDVVTPRLQQIPGFKGIVATPPIQGFTVETPDFPAATVSDNTRLFALFNVPGILGVLLRLLLHLILIILGIFGFKYQPKYEATFQMQPGQFSRFTFVTDLAQTASGYATIFHLRHIDANGQVSGGFTVVPVVVP